MNYKYNLTEVLFIKIYFLEPALVANRKIYIGTDK